MAKTGRNDLCPCGSGRKYKKCCEANERGGGTRSRVMLFAVGGAVLAAIARRHRLVHRRAIRRR